MSFVRQKMDGSVTLVIHPADSSINTAAATSSSPSNRPGSAYRPASGSRPGSASRSATRHHPIAHPLAALVMGADYGDPLGTAVSQGSYAGRGVRRVDSGSNSMNRALELPPASDKRPPSDSRRRRGALETDEDLLTNVAAVQSVEEEAEDSEQQPVGGAAAERWPSVLADGWRAYWLRTLHDIFLTSWLNLLLVCILIAVIVYYADAPAPVIFIFSLLGLVPLAERIAFVTDELAKYTSDTFGGLISASMGNVTELIVSIVAITEGGSLLLVTQLSLIGSIVSNLLLVLGCAFLAGGYKHPHQRYSKPAVNANIGLLLLGTMVLILPTLMTVTRNYNWYGINGYPAYYNVNEPNMPDTPTLHFSIAISVMMLILYGFLIYYQLFTHRSLFEKQEDDEEEETPPVLGLWGAVGWALVITALIAVLSELIVGSIESAASDIGIPIMWVSTILLPVLGNAAEHTSAIIFAYRNKMDISLGIALGSATQISLFVIPLCVCIAQMAGQDLSLDFGTFHCAVLFLSILITIVSIQTGTSDWMKGALLVFSYFVLAAGYWVIPTPAALVHPDNVPDLTDPAKYTLQPPSASSTGMNSTGS